MTDNNKKELQTFDELQKRYAKLNDKKIRTEENLKSCESALADRQSEARELFGTDDIQELEAKLATIRAENEKRRQDYQTHLGEIDTRLAAIETAHRDSSERES